MRFNAIVSLWCVPADVNSEEWWASEQRRSDRGAKRGLPLHPSHFVTFLLSIPEAGQKAGTLELALGVTQRRDSVALHVFMKKGLTRPNMKYSLIFGIKRSRKTALHYGSGSSFHTHEILLFQYYPALDVYAKNMENWKIVFFSDFISNPIFWALCFSFSLSFSQLPFSLFLSSSFFWSLFLSVFLSLSLFLSIFLSLSLLLSSFLWSLHREPEHSRTVLRWMEFHKYCVRSLQFPLFLIRVQLIIMF